LGATQLVVAALTVIGIWLGLPARWWPVDVGGTALAAVSAAAGAGLLAGYPWSVRLARAAAWAVLGGGCLVATLLALTVGHLWGLYGAVGSGGALLMGTIAALVLPYLVGLPALWLAWLRGLDVAHNPE
jgi:hypothetical protein